MTGAAGQSAGRGYLTWPNRISLMRLVLIAPFVMLLRHQADWQPHARWAALAVFVVMGLSDALDGYLARRMNWQSRLGAILDPVADKALIICATVLLSMEQSQVPAAPLPDWVVVMVVGKDIWVIVGFLLVFLLTGTSRIKPNRFGKATTFAQILMVIAILTSPEVNQAGALARLPRLGTWLAGALWWTVAAFCVAAVIGYTRFGIAQLAEHDRQGRPETHRPTPAGRDRK